MDQDTIVFLIVALCCGTVVGSVVRRLRGNRKRGCNCGCKNCLTRKNCSKR